MKTRCPRKRGLHAIWCSTVLTTHVHVAIAPLTVGRDGANISDKSVAPFARARSHVPNGQQSRSAASGDATSRCPIHGQPRRYLGRDGRGIREKPHRTRRESCDVGGASHGRGRLAGAIAARSPLSRQPSVASEGCCKLLLESTAESRATSTPTLSVVPHDHARAASPVTCSTPTRGLDTGAISAKSADDESTARDVP